MRPGQPNPRNVNALMRRASIELRERQVARANRNPVLRRAMQLRRAYVRSAIRRNIRRRSAMTRRIVSRVVQQRTNRYLPNVTSNILGYLGAGNVAYSRVYNRRQVQQPTSRRLPLALPAP